MREHVQCGERDKTRRVKDVKILGTHGEECEHAKIFEFSEGYGIAAAHDIDHFLARDRE